MSAGAVPVSTREALLAPLWLDLAGRRVVLVGGGAVAARRALGFVADGADVVVISPRIAPDLARLVAGGRVHWTPRTYLGGADLEGAWLVHAATGDPAVDAAVAEDAERAQRFCVVASRAELGTAAVPARASMPAEQGIVQVSVHGGGDPRRAVAVRDAVTDLLCSGAVDLASRRAGGRMPRELRVVV